MKERPIIFSTDMVKAILDGRKTQTRRVVVPQPKEYGVPLMKQLHWKPGTTLYNPPDLIPFCPYGQVGDRLWVRETFCVDSRGNLHYKVSEPDWIRATRKTTILIKWRPSIHMPRWASRILLEITEVRVERLQEITGKDIWAEGIERRPLEDITYVGDAVLFARQDFIQLWDSLNAKRGYGWEKNPWVWVIGFSLIGARLK